MAQIEPELTGRPCTALWTLANVGVAGRQPLSRAAARCRRGSGGGGAAARLGPPLAAPVGPLAHRRQERRATSTWSSRFRPSSASSRRSRSSWSRIAAVRAEREAARATAEVARLAAERHAADWPGACAPRPRAARARATRARGGSPAPGPRIVRGAGNAAAGPDPLAVALSGVDEPILPDQPLSSLAAFARFLCALRVSRDALTLARASHEISPRRGPPAPRRGASCSPAGPTWPCA